MPAAAAVNTSERAHYPLTWFDQIPPGPIRAGSWSDTIQTGSVPPDGVPPAVANTDI